MDESGLPFVFWVGTCPAVVISNPEDAKLVANTCIEKPHYYRFSREWVGDGLITAPGHIWKKSIKMIAGTFSSPVVTNYQAIFNRQAKKLVETLRSKVGRPFDAKQTIALTTIDAICETALGVPDITQGVIKKEYYDTYVKTLQKIVDRGLNIFHHPQFIYKNTKAYREYMEHVKLLRDVSGEVIRKLKQNKKDTESTEQNNGVPSGVRSSLDILVSLSRDNIDITEEYIQDEVNTLILAGQETVATALHFIFIMIGSKKDIQEKLFNEMKDIFCDTRRDVSKDDLERMVYCEGVICETLRLYPPVPIVLRKVDTDIQLKDCLIKEGTFCVFHAWASGRSSQIWGQDVLEFRPERWSGPTPPILAFSIGKRSCIGKRYAIQILKTMLAYCIQDLVFKSNPRDLKVKTDISLRTYGGDLIEVGLRYNK
ncbi:cytochrome P450 4g1-like [Aricia agestis]|uniref:cytochrome P450 4g1-like n=1 Tax=Aricia agestis TaxID=91739 RepID=UPI001C2051C7|nr:cytochrome P450 4g1-like [Aricia agestis]